MKGLEEVTRECVDLFERLSIPYAIMGGVAVRMHALPRPTFDVDFTVAIPRELLPRFYQAAEMLGYTVPAANGAGWVDTVKNLPVVKLQHFIGDRRGGDAVICKCPWKREVLLEARRVSE